jgi:hypothetical protein
VPEDRNRARMRLFLTTEVALWSACTETSISQSYLTLASLFQRLLAHRMNELPGWT